MESYLIANRLNRFRPGCDPKIEKCVRQYDTGVAYAGVHYIDKNGVPIGFVQSQFFLKEDILIHPSKYFQFMDVDIYIFLHITVPFSLFSLPVQRADTACSTKFHKITTTTY